MNPPRFYVCDLRGYFWRQPPEPDECHRCGHRSLWEFPTPQQARDHAATVKTVRR